MKSKILMSVVIVMLLATTFYTPQAEAGWWENLVSAVSSVFSGGNNNGGNNNNGGFTQSGNQLNNSTTSTGTILTNNTNFNNRLGIITKQNNRALSKPGGKAIITKTFFGTTGNVGVVVSTPCWGTCTRFYSNGNGTYNRITYQREENNNSNSNSNFNSISEKSGYTGGVGDGLGTSTGGSSCTVRSCTGPYNLCSEAYTGGTECVGGTGSYSCTVTNSPPGPSGTCSVATACGVDAIGDNACGGACNITSYPYCLIPDSSCIDPLGCNALNTDVYWLDISSADRIDITAIPRLVRQDAQAVLRWHSTDVDSCQVTATNGDAWGGEYGEKISSNIVKETVYTLTCDDNGTDIVDSVTVRVVPLWQEI